MSHFSTKGLFSSRIMVLTLLALVALAGFFLTMRIADNRDVINNINELEANLSSRNENNEEIKNVIESFGQTSTIEKEARERLNLKREGEHVVVILPSDGERIDNINDDAILDLIFKDAENKSTPDEGNQLLHNMSSWFNFILRR